MFLSFFYLLRFRGIPVGVHEWMTLTKAMEQGLADSSLTGFYHLCRCILVRSEADFDSLDAVFLEYFHDISSPEDLPPDFWEWLKKDTKTRDMDDRSRYRQELLELEELMERFRKRIEEQREKHDGGNYWIGTGGTSTMGHGGFHERGIRIEGESRHKSAVQVAGERHFKDFRQDEMLDIRQFQTAFRKLRQYSSKAISMNTELDVNGTVDATCEQGGLLQIVYGKPRKNTVKLLLLMDSDGSMMPYQRLCNQLFQAANKSNHFKDFRVYYFHNCIYDNLYSNPKCRRGEWVETQWVLQNLDSEYKVIFVGDAAMAPFELYRRGGNNVIGLFNEEPGVDWLYRFKSRYKNSIWLNPIEAKYWDNMYGRETLQAIKGMFPMYELTLEGLDKAIKRLLTR